MASLVAASMRRRQAPNDASLNATLTPLHNSGHNKGQDLDANGSGSHSNGGGSGGGNGGGNGGSNGGSNGGNDGGGGGGGGGSDNSKDNNSDSDSQNGQHGDGSQNNDSGGGVMDCGAAFKPLMPDPKMCSSVNENDGRLKYGPGWVLQSADPNGRSLTSHSTIINGSSVTIDFIGTYIIVFGTVFGTNTSVVPPSASYSLDGRRAIDLSLPASNRCIPNQQFFQSPIVAPGSHNLTITVTTTGTPYVLDYVWFCGPSKPSPDLSDTGSQPSHDTFSRMDAIVVGSVLGGVAFLLAMAALVWFCVRRRRKRRKLRELNIAPSPVHSWLHWQSRNGSGETEVEFTSTESIMRDNPAYSSSGDSKEIEHREISLAMPITTSPSSESPELPPGLDARARLARLDIPPAAGLAPPPWAKRRSSR